jgi:DHA1 family bicyclomycin/chloramphenicol resistance-like MFS transporter
MPERLFAGAASLRHPATMPFPSWLPLLLGLLSAVGPLSTDMYLPAFPAIQAALGGEPQVTLAAWFVGLAVGQMTQGTLSDRFGRRGPLIAGLALFTLGAVGCALAPSLGTLALMRLLGGFGGSAGMVINRAIVRDLADGHAAARLMSRLTLIMGAAPILAPTLGGVVMAYAGWQAIFWILAAYGAISGALVALYLPETLPEAARIRLGPGAIASRYAHILRERSFISHAMVGGFATAGIFAYLGGSPGVFIDLFHLSPAQYGALFGTCAAGFIISSQINPRLLPRFGASRVMRASVRVFAAAAVMLLAATAGPWGFLSIAVPVFVTMATQGYTMPNSVVGALSRHAAHAGAASALMGTLHFSLGAVAGLAVGLLADGTARPMAGLMLLCALCAAACDLLRPERP